LKDYKQMRREETSYINKLNLKFTLIYELNLEIEIYLNLKLLISNFNI